MYIYLVRHGQTIANLKHEIQGQLPGELSELGRQQAEQLGKYFQKTALDSIITSDLKRAVQTTTAIAQYHNLIPKKEKLLREQHWGNYQGKQMSNAIPGWQPGDSEFLLAPPEGESLVDLTLRAKKFWQSYSREFEGKTTLIVSHGVFLAVLLLTIFDQAVPPVHHQDPLMNASITLLRKNGTADYSIEFTNYITHLKD